MSGARVWRRAELKLLLPACFVALLAGWQPPPVILWSSDILDGFYDEVPAAVRSAEEWLGLYSTPSGTVLAPADVGFQREEAGDFTEHRITVEPGDPVFLVSGIPSLSPRDVTTVRGLPPSPSLERPRALYELGDLDYSVELATSDATLCDARISLVRGEVRQTLHRPDDNVYSCDEPHFDVLWAGDLDGDGGLDLLTELSSKYSHHPRQLYLSSQAADGDLVARVAVFDRTAL